MIEYICLIWLTVIICPVFADSKCLKDYGNPCPEGWSLSGWKEGVCDAPISYFGPCSSEIISTNNNVDKQILEEKCAVRWPCVDLCEKDLSKCPKNWLNGLDACTPSSTYRGHCGGPVNLESMEISQKIIWSLKCKVHFQCKQSCEKDYFSNCPMDWEFVRGNCEAPKSYNGPCHPIADLSFFDQKMKEQFEIICDVKYPCKPEI